jgi:hypothetical protein
MEATFTTVLAQVHELMDEVRDRCLWSLRRDYYPASAAEAIRVLEMIEQHADVALFRRAATLRQWLSRNSSDPSAA